MAAGAPGAESATAATAGTWQRRLLRHERWLWALGALALAALVGWPAWHAPSQPPMSLKTIDAALRESLMQEPLPSYESQALQRIAPSVVRVVGRMAGDTDSDAARPPGKDKNARPPRPDAEGASGDGGHSAMPRGRSVGTGVVIVESGAILTNLHVVSGAQRITVTFADGSESEAVVINRQPDNDLAVLQAQVLPDDLKPATLRSTADLLPGDRVVAVGFPFGIGPSASAGVVSGLQREFSSPDGRQSLGNLIQFDAAANPGNSGGPLVTLDGHVVGIVTAIMNPEGHSTFIGIGFAVPIESAAAAVGMPPF